MRSHWFWPGSKLRSWQFAQWWAPIPPFLQWSRIDLDLNTVGVKDQIHVACWSCSPKMCSTTALNMLVRLCANGRTTAFMPISRRSRWSRGKPIQAILKTMALLGAPLRKTLLAVGLISIALLAATWEPNHIINHLETDNKSNTEWDAVRTACQGLYQDILKNTGLTSQRSLFDSCMIWKIFCAPGDLVFATPLAYKTHPGG